MKLSSNNIVYTGVTAVGVSSTGQSVSLIPVDSRSNPLNCWGSVTDGGASTYSVQYTTSDVYAPGYTAAGDGMWTAIPSGPVGGSHPWNLTGIGATALRLNVTVGPATVTLGPIFQSDSTLGG